MKPSEATMYRSTRFTPQPSPLVRGVGALAALLASSGAVGTVDAIALYYSRQPPVASLAHTSDALRCASPRRALDVQTAS
jgi:hypothetical protein